MKFRLSSLLIVTAFIAVTVHEFSTVVESDGDLTVSLTATTAQEVDNISYRLGFSNRYHSNIDRECLRMTNLRSLHESGVESITDFTQFANDQLCFNVPGSKLRSPILNRDLGFLPDYNFVFLMIERPENNRMTYNTFEIRSDRGEINVDIFFRFADLDL